MTFTETDYDNVQKALLTGALKVKIGEREITYRSQADLESLASKIRNYLDNESASTTSTSIVQAKFSKGEA